MFRDPIHGYIGIPKCFVDNIIDTEMFQRLRNIDQTGMRVLYPAAKHDRFGHSLGVYHLGCKAVDTILLYFSQDQYWRISSDGKAITFWAKNKLLFLLACLLHDIGHAPFSHALEGLIIKNSKKSGFSINNRLIELINALENDSSVKKEDLMQCAAHEKIGALYILENMAKSIENIYDELIKCEYPHITTNDFLYAEHYYLNTTIDKSEIEQDLAFIARMILGLKYSSYKPEKQIRNCFIDLLNGSCFDVDKLDYVIRDTKMSGISNIEIDTDRLLNAVYIVTKTIYSDTVCKIDIPCELVATNISSNNPNNEFHINGNFRGVIKIEKGAKVKISNGSKILDLESDQHGKIKFETDNCQYTAKFREGAVIHKDSKKITARMDNNLLLSSEDNTPFSIHIQNAELASDFNFSVCSDDIDYSSVKLNVNGKCDIVITGKFKAESPIRIFKASLSGRITKLELADNVIKSEVPNEKKYNEFSIGYRKQAINVIANVMEARDYLYLWVYAHHKVVYYANFLLPIISMRIFPIDKEAWNLDYNHIELLDDSYVWTKFKEIYKQHFSGDSTEELASLFKDLFCRKYRLSLYKSLAEFDLLFEEIPTEKRKFIKQYLQDNLSEEPALMPTENKEAGYISKDLVEEIRRRANGKLDKIIDVVFVDAAYKQKRLIVDETLIVTSNNAIASLGEIPLLSREPKAQLELYYYFYIYYRTSSNPDEYADEAAAFREVIRNIVKEKMDVDSIDNKTAEKK